MLTLGEKAERALRIVREAPIIAYDTETSGVDWRKNQPIGYVITESATENYYVPIRHGGGGNLMDPNVAPMKVDEEPIAVHAWERELAKAFEERRRNGHLTVGHNLKFDMHFSANAGVMLGRNCGDTQNNGAMLDEYRRSFSLDSMAKDWGVTAKLGDELYHHMSEKFGGEANRKQMANYWRLAGNDQLAVEYALGDGVTTLELWHKQMEDIHDEEMDFIHDVESKLIWTLFRMERRGIKADMAYIEELVAGVEEELRQARLVLPEGFNPRSAKQVRELFEGHNITDWPITTLGNPSFTEQFLKKSEPGRAVMAVRQLTNLMSTFVEPLRERHIFEGRIHAQLNQLKADDKGTVSGRLSCSDPNLQAIHKRNKRLGRLFRRIFIADEGMLFGEADYSQCEPRLFAHYSKEPALVEGYSANPPRDMHQVVADMMNVERDPTAKRMNMGILTGMQPAAFAGHMDWTLEEAKQKHAEWFNVFPGIRDFQNTAKNVFGTRGYVKTLLGRRCRLESPRFAYRGTSRIIQGGNADIVKERLLRCDELLEASGDTIHLLMTVHDSINYQFPPTTQGRDLLAEMLSMMVDVQSAPFNLRVPFKMDTGEGPDWATATYGPE